MTHTLKNKIISILTLITFSSCGCFRSRVKLDPITAVENHDLTAIMSTGEEQVGVGYLVTRQIEGNPTDSEFVTFHAPPSLKCKSEQCGFFKIFFPDGRQTYEGTFSDGGTAKVPMSEIVNGPVFTLDMRGFYGVSVVLKYIGPQNEEMKTYIDGYLFLHVVKKPYLSLIESPEDENFYWTWKTPRGQIIKMTTGGRVYVSKLK